MQDLPQVAAGEADHPYHLPFGSTVRMRQCLMCLLPHGVTEEALAVLTYHLTLLRNAKALERVCHVPWDDPKARWRYDTRENIAAMLAMSDRKVKRATADLREAGVLLTDGPHYPRGGTTRQMFYRLTDKALTTLSLLTVPYGAMFRGEENVPASFMFSAWNEAWAPSAADVMPMRSVVQGWRTASANDLGKAIDTAFGDAMIRIKPDLAVGQS